MAKKPFLSGVFESVAESHLRYLFNAIEKGDTTAVRVVLSEDAAVVHGRHAGLCALGAAAEKGRADIVRVLLDAGADIDRADDQDRTALYYAVRSQHEDIAQLLLARGADVNRRCTSALETPLAAAVANSDTDMARLLVAQGADIHRRTARGRSLPALAADKGNAAIAQLLIDKQPVKADLNEALHIAAATGDYALVDLFLAAGADAKARSAEGDAPLHAAARGGSVTIAQRLLAAGAEIDAKDGTGSAALFIALENDRSAFAALLLQNGASPNVFQHSDGTTALMLAVRANDFDLAEMLVRAGAAVRAKNRDNATALDMAIDALQNSVENERLVSFLLSKGADPNDRDSGGATLLMAAIRNNSRPLAEKLLAAGADASLRDNRGQTALHIAVEREDWDMLDKLLAAGADPNIADNKGWTPLHNAVYGNHIHAAERLVQAGASVLVKTHDRESVLSLCECDPDDYDSDEEDDIDADDAYWMDKLLRAAKKAELQKAAAPPVKKTPPEADLLIKDAPAPLTPMPVAAPAAAAKKRNP